MSLESDDRFLLLGAFARPEDLPVGFHSYRCLRNRKQPLGPIQGRGSKRAASFPRVGTPEGHTHGFDSEIEITGLHPREELTVSSLVQERITPENMETTSGSFKFAQPEFTPPG